MRFLLVIAFCVIAGVADGATNYVADAQLSTISAVLSAAARNDTIIVPADTRTWTSTLTITKGISLIATGGYTATLITRAGIAVSIEPDATAISSEETVRVQGFTFDGNNSALNLIEIAGAGAGSAKPFKNLAIGNCRFRNSGTVTSGSGAISLNGQNRGCIFSNVFDRCNVIVKNMGNDDTTEWSNGNFPLSLGTSDQLFFEGNTIQYSSSFSGEDPGWTETGQGSRMVVRYNTWNMANTSQNELWDIHGAQNWPGGQTGTMCSEYYGNTALNCTGYRWINHRGGWGLFFNNIMTGGMAINANQYVGCVANTGAPSEEITNSYCWNNTCDGSIENMQIGDGANCSLAENRNFYNYNASFNGTAGIGRGTSAPGGTCTAGVGYWVASTATPTTDPTVIQNGVFWKATAANTWTAYYSPYTFPHPLSATESGTAASISVQPQNQAVQVGQNASFTVTAAGDPTITYQWKLGGSDISGATTSAYATNGVALAANGNSYTVGVSNSIGGELSSAATLTVTNAPGVTLRANTVTVRGTVSTR